jgi:hypothetical protein
MVLKLSAALFELYKGIGHKTAGIGRNFNG